MSQLVGFVVSWRLEVGRILAIALTWPYPYFTGLQPPGF